MLLVRLHLPVALLQLLFRELVRQTGAVRLGQLARFSQARLAEVAGGSARQGALLFRWCRGLDDSAVARNSAPQVLSSAWSLFYVLLLISLLTTKSLLVSLSILYLRAAVHPGRAVIRADGVQRVPGRHAACAGGAAAGARRGARGGAP